MHKRNQGSKWCNHSEWSPQGWKSLLKMSRFTTRQRLFASPFSCGASVRLTLPTSTCWRTGQEFSSKELWLTRKSSQISVILSTHAPLTNWSTTTSRRRLNGSRIGMRLRLLPSIVREFWLGPRPAGANGRPCTRMLFGSIPLVASTVALSAKSINIRVDQALVSEVPLKLSQAIKPKKTSLHSRRASLSHPHQASGEALPNPYQKSAHGMRREKS